ncbi:MAG: PfkB family carbohydrate kinase [Acidimicrobiales bacterium]
MLTAVEQRGIEPVPAGERRGRARGLFGVWFAANIGILSIVFGAVLASFGLDLVQALAVTVVATTASFLLVGVVSVAGSWSGMPALTLSRRALGRIGNLVPAGLSWVSVLGWEVVASVVAAWALLGLAHLAVGLRPGPPADAAALGIVVAASLVLGLLGHHAILRFQRLAAVAFGALSLLLVPFLIAHTRWSTVAGGRAAPLGAVLAAGSILAAGTGVSWVNLAPDYSRYLPRSERARAVIGWTTAGAAIPTVVLVLSGYLIATRVHGLATSLDPVGPVGAVLPAWLSAPYLLAAVGGMLAETDLACYSSGLTLLALGVRIRRSRTVYVDAAVVCLGGLWLMLGRQGFLGPFESFLELLAAGLSSWAGVVLADLARARTAGRRSGLDLHYGSWPAIGGVGVAAWAAGTVIALATTVSPFFTGPLARGTLGEGSFGFVLGLATTLVVAVGGWWYEGRRAVRRSEAARAPAGGSSGGSSSGPETPSPAVATARGIPGLPVERRAPERLVLVGSILVDILLYVEELPGRGGDVLADDHLLVSGGGFNVLTAATRLGLPGAYAGRIGEGPFGRQVACDLELAGVTSLLTPVVGADTGFTVGIVESTGERTFFTMPGVESRLDASDLGRLALRPQDAIYVSGYDLGYPVSGPALRSWILDLAPSHLLAVDPGPLAASAPGRELLDVLGRVDLLSVNAREARLLSGSHRPDEGAAALAALLVPGGVAVVRVGPDGCWIACGGAAPEHVPGHPVDAVDTTGAGDVHVGAMLARLAAGDEPRSAAAIANVAAALSVGRPGGAAGPSMTELADVLDRPAVGLARHDAATRAVR